MQSLYPSYDVFLERWKAGKHQAVWSNFINDLETPVSAYLKLATGHRMPFLLESVEGGSIRGRYSFIGRDPDLIWRTHNGKASLNGEPVALPPLAHLKQLLSESKLDFPDLPQPMAAGLFGYLGYDMVAEMEPVALPKTFAAGGPEALLTRPNLLAIFDQIESKFILCAPVWYAPDQSPEQAWQQATARINAAKQDLAKPLPLTEVIHGKAAIADPQSNMTEQHFLGMVEKAKDYIKAGDIFQVVLSQRFSVPFHLPPLALYRAVRRLDPSPFLFLFDFGDHALVGSSPEIMVRVRDGKITLRPIAGTRPRGQGNWSDAELAADLLSDEKELAEHLMLLDLGRNDVGRVARPGTVRVTAMNTIETYRHVMHIVSNVEGALDAQYTALDALIAGFPAGTVSGSPKVRAMQIISELEPDRRGIYAGCAGYIGFNNSMDMAIAIRTALIKKQQVHVQAGAGIVYDSNAQSEYRETVAKARGMLKAVEEALLFQSAEDQ